MWGAYAESEGLCGVGYGECGGLMLKAKAYSSSTELCVGFRGGVPGEGGVSKLAPFSLLNTGNSV